MPLRAAQEYFDDDPQDDPSPPPGLGLAPGVPGGTPGTLALSGSFAQTAAGIFAAGLESTADHSLFFVAGSVSLDGTLALSCTGACGFAVGDRVTLTDSFTALSGVFAAVTLSGFATGAFDAVYDTAGGRVDLPVTQAVAAAVPEPAGWVLWLGGVALMASLARRRRGY